MPHEVSSNRAPRLALGTCYLCAHAQPEPRRRRRAFCSNPPILSISSAGWRAVRAIRERPSPSWCRTPSTRKAGHVRIERRRVRRSPALAIRDDGEGVLPELSREEALRTIATNIGCSRKRNLTPLERHAQVVAGKYGIGLLGFWSVGRPHGHSLPRRRLGGLRAASARGRGTRRDLPRPHGHGHRGHLHRRRHHGGARFRRAGALGTPPGRLPVGRAARSAAGQRRRRHHPRRSGARHGRQALRRGAPPLHGRGLGLAGHRRGARPFAHPGRALLLARRRAPRGRAGLRRHAGGRRPGHARLPRPGRAALGGPGPVGTRRLPRFSGATGDAAGRGAGRGGGGVHPGA